MMLCQPQLFLYLMIFTFSKSGTLIPFPQAAQMKATSANILHTVDKSPKIPVKKLLLEILYRNVVAKFKMKIHNTLFATSALPGSNLLSFKIGMKNKIGKKKQYQYFFAAAR